MNKTNKEKEQDNRQEYLRSYTQSEQELIKFVLDRARNNQKV